MAKCSKQYVPRQVIERQLLAALDDKSKAAIVVSKDDLDLLIYGVALIPDGGAEQRSMLADLEQLRKECFG